MRQPFLASWAPTTIRSSSKMSLKQSFSNVYRTRTSKTQKTNFNSPMPKTARITLVEVRSSRCMQPNTLHLVDSNISPGMPIQLTLPVMPGSIWVHLASTIGWRDQPSPRATLHTDSSKKAWWSVTASPLSTSCTNVARTLLRIRPVPTYTKNSESSKRDLNQRR